MRLKQSLNDKFQSCRNFKLHLLAIDDRRGVLLVTWPTLLEGMIGLLVTLRLREFPLLSLLVDEASASMIAKLAGCIDRDYIKSRLITH